VRIATEGAHPPFNFIDANGQPAGFEVELGRALCEAARLDCVFVVHEWEGLIKGLLARDYDAIMNSLAITPKRKLRVLFSRPYYRIPLSFIVRKDSDLKGIAPGDLAGRSIGTAGHNGLTTFLETRYPQAETRTFDKLEDADLDLLTERIDLVFGDKLTLAAFLATREGGCCRLLGDLPRDEPVLGEGVAIALRPDDLALKQTFDAAIAKVQADGTYDRIRAKHLSVDVK
jgi:polar amino acid transport system substrate-binding protein